MFKNKSIVILMCIAISGCDFEFDSGSTSKSISAGSPISLVCFKENVTSIEGLAVVAESDKKIELSGTGIKSTIEFEEKDSQVVSYSISTKTEKSKDSNFHKVIEEKLAVKCS